MRQSRWTQVLAVVSAALITLVGSALTAKAVFDLTLS
jgi:hypothetical protein